MTKTHSTTAKEIQREWHLIDLTGKILGRMASKIAYLLIGKNKPYFTPHLDCGDYVVVINANKVKVSGRKRTQKIYYRHSGYPGGLKKLNFEQMMKKNPRKVIELAINGMLPKNKLRNRRMQRVKIFENNRHPYKDKLDNLNQQDN